MSNEFSQKTDQGFGSDEYSSGIFGEAPNIYDPTLNVQEEQSLVQSQNLLPAGAAVVYPEQEVIRSVGMDYNPNAFAYPSVPTRQDLTTFSSNTYERPILHPKQQLSGDSPINNENAHMLGLSVLLVGVGTWLGVKYAGGIFGGLAGSLLAGGAINAYRAVKYYREGSLESDAEAKVSGTYAVISAGVGLYLLTQHSTKYKSRASRFNENSLDEEESSPESILPTKVVLDKKQLGCNPCNIRKAGP